MNFPKMTTEQKRFNDMQFNDIVDMVRRINSGAADLLMQNRLPVDMHFMALEEIERRQPVCMD